MEIKDKLTIVIPSKNEEKYITNTILSIVKQRNIKGVRIIIADAMSTDKTRAKIITLKHTYKDIVNIEMIDGGTVSYARNKASEMVTTKYILFIDSDAILKSDTLISDTMREMEENNLTLLTCKISSYGKDIRTALSFMLFNIVNKIISIKTPFAVGMFFLTDRDSFRIFGGFDESLAHSEDYFLSKKYTPSRFKISSHYVGQDDRRFKKMGYLGMIKLLIKGYFNRNNKVFFQKSVNYW